MKADKYPTEASINKLIYTFESIGIKKIEKIVQYTKISSEEIGLPPYIEVYNLGFGDWDNQQEDYSDEIRSNNGDTNKVLATVANTTKEFWSSYPDAVLYFKGSQPLGEQPIRTRLYQMGINRYFNEISEVADVYGLSEDGWQVFKADKNYTAFLISKKD
jgi:hypothetical protein